MEEFNEHWKYAPPDIGLCGLINHLPTDPNLFFWADLVQRFNTRSLTYESDTLNAFAGITSVVSKSFPGGFFYGLPVIYFELGLLWQPRGKMRRRDAKDNQGAPVPLPSWSWVGWDGDLDLWLWNLGRWSIGKSGKPLEIFPFVKWHSQRNKNHRNASSPNNELSLNPDRIDPDNNSELAQRVVIPTDANFTDHTLPNPVAFAEQGFEPSLRRDSTLNFQTTRASLEVRGLEAGKIIRESDLCVMEFVDTAGQIIGAMITDRSQPAELLEGIFCEVIAISMGEVRVHSHAWRIRDDIDWALPAWYRNIDAEPSEKDCFEFYNVLWIEWKDVVAYRKALGRVIKPAWDKLDLKIIDVVLG
jgi:hypothetical protein